MTTTPLQRTAYTATATVTGGRDGHARTDDGLLDVDVRVPRELGGAGGGTNPERLFAAGYGDCFLSTLAAGHGLRDVLEVFHRAFPDQRMELLAAMWADPGLPAGPR